MIFEKFIQDVEARCTERFANIAKGIQQGFVSTRGSVELYPNIILFIKCPGYFIVELLGATPKFQGLTVKRTESTSVSKYFYQFSDSSSGPAMCFNGSRNAMINLNIGREADIESVANRFPSVMFNGSNFVFQGGAGSVIIFGESFRDCHFDSCLIINSHENIHRCKDMLASYVFKSDVDRSGVHSFFETIIDEHPFSGMRLLSEGSSYKQIVASQLQNMFLFDNLRETTLGEFIKLHPQIVCDAFDAESFIYEPSFEWLEHDGSCEDHSINPDLMVKRRDGYYDIFDLKTALLGRRSVTKGGRSRRRFIDGVNEGLAQLANYREYFSYEQNANHAYEKYGIRVRDPKLVLIVGNLENTQADEVSQACRLNPEVTVVDWDTLCHLFIAGGGLTEQHESPAFSTISAPRVQA